MPSCRTLGTVTAFSGTGTKDLSHRLLTGYSFPLVETSVPARGNRRFCKWRREFPQVGTRVSASGNGRSCKRKRECLLVGEGMPFILPLDAQHIADTLGRIQGHVEFQVKVIPERRTAVGKHVIGCPSVDGAGCTTKSQSVCKNHLGSEKAYYENDISI